MTAQGLSLEGRPDVPSTPLSGLWFAALFCATLGSGLTVQAGHQASRKASYEVYQEATGISPTIRKLWPTLRAGSDRQISALLS